ncbi:Hypothetical protein GLP15_200 [Giardia lamblia P15]|uniref:Uncharacterized protein n=1 Tax=Giardia intestinalis (strain P15) TaxID=658858 RepID=E1F1H1_GIAIA|nr:Hypothetical protein GLP15_200 [Giardia lamblia P15]
MLSKTLLLSAYEIGASQVHPSAEEELTKNLQQEQPEPVYMIPDGCPRLPISLPFSLPKTRSIGSCAVTNIALILSALNTAVPIAFTSDGNVMQPSPDKTIIHLERIDTCDMTSMDLRERNVLTEQLYNAADLPYYLLMLKELYKASVPCAYSYTDMNVPDRAPSTHLFNLCYLSLSNLGIRHELDANQQFQPHIEKTAFYLLMSLALIQPAGANHKAHFIINVMCCLYANNPAVISQTTSAPLFEGLHVYTEAEYIDDILQHGGLEDSEALSTRLLKNKKISGQSRKGLRNSTKEVVSRKYGLQALFTGAALSLAKYADAIKVTDQVSSGNFQDLSPHDINTSLALLLIAGKHEKVASILKFLNIPSLSLIIVQGCSLNTQAHCEKLIREIAMSGEGAQQESIKTLRAQCREVGIDPLLLLGVMSGQIHSLKVYCTTVLDCLLASLHLCPGTVGDSLHLAERLSEQCNLHKEFSDDLTVILMKHYAGIPCLTLLERQLIDDQLEKDRDRRSYPLAQDIGNAGPSGFQIPPFAQSQYLKLTKTDDENPPSDLFIKLTIGYYTSRYNEILIFIVVSILLGLGFGPKDFYERQILLQPYSLAASYYLQRHHAYDFACIPLLTIPDSIFGAVRQNDISAEVYTVLQSCIDKIIGSYSASFKRDQPLDARKLNSEYSISPELVVSALQRYECWVNKRISDPHMLLDCAQVADCVNYI